MTARAFVTYSSHVKTSSISHLKAHLSEELRAVRRGERIIVLDRDIPVAELRPCEEAPVIRVRPPLGKLRFPRPSFSTKGDPLDYLKEDRSRR